MNSAPLNGVVFNGAPLDAVQRSATLVDVVAQVTLQPRVWARALIDTAFTAQADVAAGSRVRARAVLEWLTEAAVAYTIKNFTSSPTSWFAQAEVNARGEAQDRTEVREPLVVDVGALTVFDARVLVRAPTGVTAAADIVAQESSFSQVRSPESLTASADIWLQFDVLRRIPYDEDTVDERTIVVPEDQRLVYVS